MQTEKIQTLQRISFRLLLLRSLQSPSRSSLSVCPEVLLFDSQTRTTYTSFLKSHSRKCVLFYSHYIMISWSTFEILFLINKTVTVYIYILILIQYIFNVHICKSPIITHSLHACYLASINQYLASRGVFVAHLFCCK